MKLDELQQLLASFRGATFASLDTVTIPQLLGGKKNPFKGKVEKHCLGHRVMLFTNTNSNAYLNKVRRHLEREGKNPDSFELSPRRWGERLPNSPIVQHNGKHYLEVVFLESGDVEYRASETILYSPHVDSFDAPMCWNAGEVIPKHCIQGLNERSGSEHQGLDDKVIVRCFALDSIKAIRAFHEELA